jgi:acyl-coenzyme A synthetase/AMP-(fatty) acid ligase
VLGATACQRAFGAATRTSCRSWQHPDKLEFIDVLPRTATGKLKKTELREGCVHATV